MSEAGGKLVVLDIATKTCGPCKFIYPKVVKLSLEYPDIVFLKIFGDLNEETRVGFPPFTGSLPWGLDWKPGRERAVLHGMCSFLPYRSSRHISQSISGEAAKEECRKVAC